MKVSGYHLNLHLEKTETNTGYHVPSITTKESYPGKLSIQRFTFYHVPKVISSHTDLLV